MTAWMACASIASLSSTQRVTVREDEEITVGCTMLKNCLILGKGSGMNQESEMNTLRALAQKVAASAACTAIVFAKLQVNELLRCSRCICVFVWRDVDSGTSCLCRSFTLLIPNISYACCISVSCSKQANGGTHGGPRNECVASCFISRLCYR